MNIGVIGLGHMGRAFIEGLVNSGVRQADITVNARTIQSVQAVKDEFPALQVAFSKRDLVSRADMIVIAVKPQNAAEVLGEIGRFGLKGKLIVSFMAGISLSDTRSMLGDESGSLSVVRMMPNLAIAKLNGVIGVCYEGDIPAMDKAGALFRRLGYMIRVSEERLDVITVCAGSGPAFAAYLMQQYREACLRLLGDAAQSEELMRRMFENALDMTADGGMTLEALIDKISTKGGVTEAGVTALKCSGIGSSMDYCFSSALRRITELKPAK